MAPRRARTSPGPGVRSAYPRRGETRPGGGPVLRVKRRVDRVLGERVPLVAALVDRRRPRDWARWGTACNGQAGRREIMAALAAALPLDGFVETGTFRGMTTSFARDTMGLTVHSVELNPRFYAFCKWRFRHDPGVLLSFGDSRAFLRSLPSAPAPARARLLFYLDAHWNDDLPLAEEVAVVASSWPEWVIVVDDFEVPGDPGYGFDSYGDGLALRLADIPLEAPGRALYFPSLASGDETGMRRGCVVICPEGWIADALDGLPSLRRHRA